MTKPYEWKPGWNIGVEIPALEAVLPAGAVLYVGPRWPIARPDARKFGTCHFCGSVICTILGKDDAVLSTPNLVRVCMPCYRMFADAGVA